MIQAEKSVSKIETTEYQRDMQRGVSERNSRLGAEDNLMLTPGTPTRMRVAASDFPIQQAISVNEPSLKLRGETSFFGESKESRRMRVH